MGHGCHLNEVVGPVGHIEHCKHQREEVTRQNIDTLGPRRREILWDGSYWNQTNQRATSQSHVICLDQWEASSPVAGHAAPEPEPGRPAPGVWGLWLWLLVWDPVLVGGVLEQRILMRVEIRGEEGNEFVYHKDIIPFDVWQWRAWEIEVIYAIFAVLSITRPHVSIPIFRVFRLRSENDDQLQLLLFFRLCWKFALHCIDKLLRNSSN